MTYITDTSGVECCIMYFVSFVVINNYIHVLVNDITYLLHGAESFLRS